MRQIYVNLPVRDLEASKRFFTQLGFSFDTTFQDETATCMVVEENIFVMLLTEARFRDFIVGDIADRDTTEVLVAISADSPEEVDRLVDRALEVGGSPWKPTIAQGPMYCRTFRDPDGHVWEVLHMDLSKLQTQPVASEA